MLVRGMDVMDAATIGRDTRVGVTHAFDQLYRRHWREVYRFSLRYGGGDPSWAEDIAHDVFVKLLENLPQLERPADVRAWLYRVTANIAITKLRRERSWVGRLSMAWRALQTTSAVSPEVLALRHEKAAEALNMLRRLPAQERMVACMKLLDHRTQKEIAEVLGLSEGYVSKLLSRALTRVRAEGWEVDDV
jgi:RNA polymerase sigma factor (sigma-70 family)